MTDTSFYDFNPWVGDATQTSRTRAFCEIYIGGQNVTDKIDPYLISVRLIDGFAGNYQCHIELDDRDARLPIPGQNTDIWVGLGWESEALIRVWDGVVLEVEHGFGRKQGGRRLWIHGGAGHFMDEMKTPLANHWGEGTPPGTDPGEGTKVKFDQVYQDVAKASGLSGSIHPEMAAKARDFWHMSNESPQHFVERFAQTFGAVWQIRGGSLIFTKPGEDASGARTDTIVAEWGKNLIGWKVHPWRARPGWTSSNQSYFDSRAGQWKNLLKNFSQSMPWSQSKAKYSFPAPAPNKSVAEQHNDGAALSGTYVPGGGRIVMNGEPTAACNKHVQLIGARPGVDGTYFIWTAEHSYSRQGYVTWLDVWPETEATGAGAISRPFTTGVAPFESFNLPTDQPATFDQRFPTSSSGG